MARIERVLLHLAEYRRVPIDPDDDVASLPNFGSHDPNSIIQFKAQHFLNFIPLPHGHGWLRPGLADRC